MRLRISSSETLLRPIMYPHRLWLVYAPDWLVPQIWYAIRHWLCLSARHVLTAQVLSTYRRSCQYSNFTSCFSNLWPRIPMYEVGNKCLGAGCTFGPHKGGRNSSNLRCHSSCLKPTTLDRPLPDAVSYVAVTLSGTSVHPWVILG